MPSTKSKRSTASREWRVSVIKKKLEYVGTVVAADKANAEAQAVAFASAESAAPNTLTFGLLGASGCLFMLSLLLGGAALRFWRNR